MSDAIIGFHAIEEGLKTASGGSILYLARGTGSKTEVLENLARMNRKTIVRKVSKAELDRLAGGANHRGALLVPGSQSKSPSASRQLTVREFCSNLKEEEGALVLILDGITDPHNLGAILRSADQFSVSLVIIPSRRSAQSNQTVVKVSSGAAHHVKQAVVTNLNREIEYLKSRGFWVYGAALGGKSLHEATFPKRTALVLGSEGRGISRLTEQLCDHIVAIPTTGNIDSLNVSVAAGIFLYEIRRQQA
ncbi:MAG: 23S rRNA (guanosine(2251)-2'-O)-methyltransferase RlmB [Spirochaetales bacterium]|nr:23S rRNA (guanosine(2251)-2'-O)-methyltransferase RlmB [Spirochaetales bacterium]